MRGRLHGLEPTRDTAAIFAALRGLDPRVPIDDPVVLSRSDDGLVVRVDDIVLKVHEAGTDEGELSRRIEVVRARSDVFLQPLSPAIEPCGDRLVTRWPLAHALHHDDANLPWAEAATLLARLHAAPADDVDPARALPVGGGPRRVLRAVERLRDAPPSPERDVVLAAFATLSSDEVSHARGDRVVHGDFHLGQLVTSSDGLRLIDVEEVGRGDPAWDLARPAAWYAAGLMPEPAWHSFLDAYFAVGSGAFPAHDLWVVLEAPARALVVQTAARGVGRREPGAPLDGFDLALLGACERIARSPRGEPATPPLTARNER
jgi:hypothetical protein